MRVSQEWHTSPRQALRSKWLDVVGVGLDVIGDARSFVADVTDEASDRARTWVNHRMTLKEGSQYALWSSTGHSVALHATYQWMCFRRDMILERAKVVQLPDVAIYFVTREGRLVRDNQSRPVLTVNVEQAQAIAASSLTDVAGLYTDHPFHGAYWHYQQKPENAASRRDILDNRFMLKWGSGREARTWYVSVSIQAGGCLLKWGPWGSHQAMASNPELTVSFGELRERLLRLMAEVEDAIARVSQAAAN